MVVLKGLERRVAEVGIIRELSYRTCLIGCEERE